MISRWLLRALAAEFLLLAAVIGGATTFAPASLLWAFAGLILVNLGLAAATYAVLRLVATARRPRRTDGARRCWRSAAGEVLALFASFALLQPFERWWMGAEPSGPASAGRIPVLLVHGYLCNRGAWWWMRRRLRARNYMVATINLEPPLASIDALATQLSGRIDAVLALTGAAQVVLVTHSMGGLVARAYLQRCGAGRVAALVTLGAPHHGTEAARLGCGQNARQMQPGGPWLQALEAGPLPGVPCASIWSPADEFLLPPETARLASARATVLSDLGHLAMLYSPAVLACVVAELGPA